MFQARQQFKNITAEMPREQDNNKVNQPTKQTTNHPTKQTNPPSNMKLGGQDWTKKDILTNVMSVLPECICIMFIPSAHGVRRCIRTPKTGVIDGYELPSEH